MLFNKEAEWSGEPIDLGTSRNVGRGYVQLGHGRVEMPGRIGRGHVELGGRIGRGHVDLGDMALFGDPLTALDETGLYVTTPLGGAEKFLYHFNKMQDYPGIEVTKLCTWPFRLNYRGFLTTESIDTLAIPQGNRFQLWLLQRDKDLLFVGNEIVVPDVPSELAVIMAKSLPVLWPFPQV